MKQLALIPPLVALCSDLVLHPLAVAAFFPIPNPTPTAQTEHLQIRGPSWVRGPYQVIRHPPTNSCVLTGDQRDSTPLRLGPCEGTDPWYLTPQNILTIDYSYFCLQAKDAGEHARLNVSCEPSQSRWDQVEGGDGKTRLVSKGRSGKELCLDVSADGVVVTNPCVVGGGGGGSGSGSGSADDSQWFQIAKVENKKEE